ncbi:MAG: B12-binding domain-containing radical SAM protein [Lachnospiraceae bacterium]|nr:B12-binding domain-containing radical SAM protein [Lachnospiraceae bacterium]
MKFLLAAVNTKYIHSNPAVYSLKAYAEKKDSDLKGQIEIAEYTINHQISDILADLYVRKPDAIGFSCYIWNINYVLELAEEIKKLLPQTVIWLGGPEVSFDADILLKAHPFLTGVICGEGEETFYQLMQAYRQAQEEGKSFDTVSAGKFQNAEVILSEVPFLYEDSAPFENRILYYESSRGCPFRCSYCLSSIDKTVRLRDIEIVKKELAFFIEKKVSQVKFVDRTFNCNKAHALAIWEYLLAHDNGVTNFHFEIAADLLGEEELALLAKFRPGALQLEIGVQSTNTQTIDEIDRRMDVERLRRVVKRIHDGGNIHIHLDLIAGLPYEDYTSFAASFNDVFAMQPEQLQLGFLKVLKGSKMHKRAGDYGLVYRSKPPYEVLYTNWLSFAEVCRLKRIEEMVEIYHNSNQFTMTLPVAVQKFPSAFAFFEELADYYEEKGYFIQSPARSYRYQILLSFLKEKLLPDETQEMFYAECLTLDLYLRENCKTRPDFAPDESPYKENMRAFFHAEAEQHNVLGSAYAQYDARMLARSVHIEPVRFDYKTGNLLPREEYLLFDYKDRNALTYEAKTYRIGMYTDE